MEINSDTVDTYGATLTKGIVMSGSSAIRFVSGGLRTGEPSAKQVQMWGRESLLLAFRYRLARRQRVPTAKRGGRSKNQSRRRDARGNLKGKR